MSAACRYSLTCFGFVLATTGFILGFWVFPNIISSKIDDSIKLSNGSEAYERWEDIPIPLQFKVYFFNITNAQDVQNGKKPIVQEVGPYVYGQFEHKYSIVQEEENLTYFQNHKFFFNEDASKPFKENDSIIVPNLPLMSIINTLKFTDPKKLGLFNSMIDDFANEPKDLFLNTRPKDFLFDGIYFNCKKGKTQFLLEYFCNKIIDKAPEQIKRVDDYLKFSLLQYKNNTHDGLFKINSGEKDINSLGKILEWKGSSKLNNWKESGNCNKIYGTDTTIFPPRRDRDSIIEVFQSDICRSVNLHFDQEVEYKGISALRYIVQEDMLGSPSNFTENECYCMNNTGGILGDDDCLMDGALELKSCLKSPIILTFPHLYMAHDIYKSTVDGFKPQKNLHETFVDLEPNTGVVLRGSKRAQFNIFYQPTEKIDLTTNLKDTLMPVVWIDQGVELTDVLIDKIKSELILPKLILEIVYWSMIGVGLLIGILGLIWSYVFVHKPKKLS